VYNSASSLPPSARGTKLRQPQESAGLLSWPRPSDEVPKGAADTKRKATEAIGDVDEPTDTHEKKEGGSVPVHTRHDVRESKPIQNELNGVQQPTEYRRLNTVQPVTEKRDDVSANA
jgi:hypothetical protein